jgi:hypothetical protein
VKVVIQPRGTGDGEQGPTGPTGAASTVPGPTGPTGPEVTGPTGPSGIDVVKGTATLDFGTGSLTTETVLTGLVSVSTSSVIITTLKIVATPEHRIDDLLIDPIRLAVKDLVAGVGFTIYGEMDNARANGTYEIDWLIT